MAKPRVISARPTYPERARTGAVPTPRGFIGQTIAALDRMGSTSQFAGLQRTVAGRVGDPGISALDTKDLNLTRSRFKGTPLNVPRLQEVQFDTPRPRRRAGAEAQAPSSTLTDEGFDAVEFGGGRYDPSPGAYDPFEYGHDIPGFKYGGKVTKRR